MQFEYCFSIIGLYIDIYGYGMLSMGFKYNINIDMVWIPESENDKADLLSCIVDSDDWSILEYIYQII